MSDKILEKLNPREEDVMSVLWKENASLTASGIANIDPTLSINTIQNVLKKLVNKGYIEVADIVYSGTVLTRSYRNLISAEEYVGSQIRSIKKSIVNFSTLQFVDAILDEEEEDFLKEVDQLIQKKREKK